jgi:hypothetical protein
MTSRLNLTRNLGYLDHYQSFEALNAAVFEVLKARQIDREVQRRIPHLRDCRSAFLEAVVAGIEYRIDLIVQGDGEVFREVPIFVSFPHRSQDCAALHGNCTRPMFKSVKRFEKYVELLALMTDEPTIYLIHKANDRGNRFAAEYEKCARVAGLTLVSFSLLLEMDGYEPEFGSVARRACWDLVDRSSVVVVDYLADQPGIGMLQEWAIAAEKGKPWFAFTRAGEALHKDMTLPKAGERRVECARGIDDVQEFMISTIAPTMRRMAKSL